MSKLADLGRDEERSVELVCRSVVVVRSHVVDSTKLDNLGSGMLHE